MIKPLAKGIWSAVSPFIWPNSEKKLRALLLGSVAAAVLHPFAAPLLPTAEEFLEGEHLNPALAQELAPGRRVYFIQDGVLAKSLFLLRTPFAPLAGSRYLLHYVAPGASTLATYNPTNFSNNSVVTLSPSFKERGVAFFIHYMTRIPEENIKNLPISIDDQYKIAALHEIRHSAQAQDGMGLTKEPDSDYYSAIIAARELNKPEIIKYVFNLRAAHEPGDGHDGALYLDAKLNGLPVPSTKEVRAANEEAGKFVEEKRSDLSSLSPLARKRVEFYRAAWNYFTTPPAHSATLQKTSPTPEAPKIS